MPEFSPIAAEVLGRIHEIDVSGETDEIYVQRGTVLEPRAEKHARPWYTAEEWSEEVALWEGYVRSGGTAFGAFEDNRFLGFSVLRIHLDQQTAQLAGLYVDLGWRRHGLGRALVLCATESARVGAMRRNSTFRHRATSPRWTSI